MNRIKAFFLLIKFFKNKNIDYCILGNSKDYALLIESDIDIVVNKETFNHLISPVQEYCSINNFKLVQIKKHESSACSFVLQLDNNTFLQLDFCHDYLRNRRLYFKAQPLLNNKILPVSEPSFYVLVNHYEFVYYITKKIDKNQINLQQFNHLLSCWKIDKVQILLLLNSYFSKESLQIINGIFDHNDFNLLTEKMNYLRSDLFSKKKIRFKHQILEVFRLIGKAYNPPGLIIGILGCDGAGKSTLVKELQNQFQFCFQNYSSYHLYPGFIFKHNSVGDFNNPHVQIRRGKVLSFFKLLLFIPEYFIGYWYKVFPKIMRVGLIIFDRYFIDILADPLRYRNGVSQKTSGIINKFIPQPHLWLLLDLSPEVLLKRKAEISYEMAVHLRKNYLQIAETLPNCLVINAENTVSETVNAASSFVVNFMHKRILKKIKK